MKSITHWFPSEKDLREESNILVYYNSKSDEVACYYHTLPTCVEELIDFTRVSPGNEEFSIVIKEIRRRKASIDKQASRKEFIDAFTSSLKLKSAVVTQRFLTGATEKTKNGGLHIDGDFLMSNHLVLLKRVDDNNFLLGLYLSNYSGWQIPNAHKILPVIASSNKNFWRSTLQYQQDTDPLEDYILAQVKDLIAYCYIKWPWCRKIDKSVYAYQFQEVLVTLEQATQHFKTNFDLGPMHQIMVDTFGHRQEMVDQISAFRISYELTG